MNSEKNSCCQGQDCCPSSASNASVWGAAIFLTIVVAAAVAFIDWRGQQRLWLPYGNEVNAQNAFHLQEIQYSALSAQVAKDPQFFDKVTQQANAQAAQAAGGGQQAAQGGEPSQPEVKKISAEQATALKGSPYVDGTPNARFTVYEFSDLECPFCKRQEDQGVINALKGKFPNEINRVFKVNPLPFHAQAHIAATAVLCAGEIGGASAYYKGITSLFAAGDASNGHFEDSVPAGLGKTLKLDAKKFDACYKSDKFADAIKSTIAQGAALGVQGTPGNVIVDNQTGNYVLLAGAFPLEYFTKAIDQLKAAAK